MTTKQCRKVVIEELKEQGLFIREEELVHVVIIMKEGAIVIKTP